MDAIAAAELAARLNASAADEEWAYEVAVTEETVNGGRVPKNHRMYDSRFYVRRVRRRLPPRIEADASVDSLPGQLFPT